MKSKSKKSTTKPPTTRAARAAIRRRRQVLRAKAGYRQRLRAKEEQERAAKRYPFPLWRRPEPLPLQPHEPTERDPGILTNAPPRPKRLTAKQRERRDRAAIERALARDKAWVEANRDLGWPDCRLSASSKTMCPGGLGKASQGLLCDRCIVAVGTIGAAPVEVNIRIAISRFAVGRMPFGEFTPSKGGPSLPESAASWGIGKRRSDEPEEPFEEWLSRFEKGLRG